MSSDMVSDWLKAASRYPLLTADQEIDLAHKVQRGMAEGATSAEKRIGARAKNKMIQSNLKLVVSAAKKFIPVTWHSNALDLADLLQEGVIGLNRAVEKFDPTAGYKLSTYAYWWIRQSISRAIEMQKTTIRITTQIGQLANKARKAPEWITTRQELQEWLGATDNQMEMIERAQAIGRINSLDKMVREEGSTLLELIPDEQNQPNLDAMDWELARESIQYVFEGEPLIEEFSKFVVERVSYKEQADALGINRGTLSNQVHSLIRRKKDDLAHLRKFIAA